MSTYVLDTNVAVVANGGTEQATSDCILNCLRILEQIKEKGILVLDDARLILTEYMNNLSPSGQPGAGDAFMKWVWINQANPIYCELVSITPKPCDSEDFEEFPNDPGLRRFDRSDRKFVAVALTSSNKPKILNAVDTDWWKYRVVLRRHGIRIRFLCPEMMVKRGRVRGAWTQSIPGHPSRRLSE